MNKITYLLGYLYYFEMCFPFINILEDKGGIDYVRSKNMYLDWIQSKTIHPVKTIPLNLFP
jgi:hypothetical protein